MQKYCKNIIIPGANNR